MSEKKGKIKLILVGGGGLFLEVSEYISASNDAYIFGYLATERNSGVLDIDYLGDVSEAINHTDCCFLIAIGNPQTRNRIYNALKGKCKFYTFIDTKAIVSRSAVIGEGAIICPNVILNARSTIKPNVLVNVNASVGHEAYVGESSVLSPYSALNGSSKIGKMCFLGTRATVFPGKTLGDSCTVDTHSFVKSDVPEKHIVSTKTEYLVLKNRLMR
jgi:sugar O-acyltransferase (sialic acid O-acetyltransferase NeuD family)